MRSWRMAETESSSEQNSTHSDPHHETEPGAQGSSPAAGADCLSAAQKDVLERCLHALTHAKNDSHVLAALLLITRLCPANQLERATLHRVFEAVGFNLPARLLVTAIRGSESSGLPPKELLSLGTALLAALSTDPEMASHPQLLSTVPLVLGLLEGGAPDGQKRARCDTGASEQTHPNPASHQTSKSTPGKQAPTSPSGSEDRDEAVQPPTCTLDEAVAADCYQVLSSLCALPRGPDRLLSRGAIPALCRAVSHKQALSCEKGLPLLAHLLSSSVRQRAWSKHPSELLSLLNHITQNFSQTSDLQRLVMCAQIPRFLPPPGGEPTNQELREAVGRLWATLRPAVQGKLGLEQLGHVLVLSACLLDLCGWDPAGPPKFCCLLVNRACVEVRMALEEPPSVKPTAQQQHTLTACYRILEAAMEQACSMEESTTPPQPGVAIAGLSLQQSRQVLGVLEEAFSAVIYYLKQVEPSQYDDPFVFATFRSLCAWLAEETSCLKEDIVALLPFLIAYTKHHLQDKKDKGLADWMSEMSVTDGSQAEPWTNEQVLRYLLPALCHLSAEGGPRKVLLSLDTPALLVDYLTRGWGVLKTQSGKTVRRDPSLETACSALLNFVVTEPERVRTDSCFASLDALLSEALPIILHKSRLLVLTANFCTLGLMINRLKPTLTGLGNSNQQRFFSSALRFLRGALQTVEGESQARVSPVWAPWWDEVCELWRLSLQALGSCVKVQPWITTIIREEAWLQNILSLLESCCSLPDPQTQEALEEALCAIAQVCTICRQDVSVYMNRGAEDSLHCMSQLRKILVS